MRGREPQLVRPDLGQLPGGPHAAQRQRRVGPREQHQLDRRRQVQQQESELVMAVRLADHVVVVQHQNDRLRQLGQLIDQQRKQRLGKIRRLAPDEGQDIIGTELRAGALQSMGDVPPQPARIVVTGIERHPGERAAFGRAQLPLGNQRRLAEARRGGGQHKLGVSTRQPGDQLRTLHPLRPGRRSVQLRLENHTGARSRCRREVSSRRGWLRRNDTARSIGSVAVIVRIYGMKLTISGENWANLWSSRRDIPLSAAHVTPSWWTYRCLDLEQPPGRLPPWHFFRS